MPTQPSQWQHELQNAFTEASELLRYLGLSQPAEPLGQSFENPFRMLVTRTYADLMERGNPYDPLLRQVIPVAAEAWDPPGFGTDPVGDGAAIVAPGVLHKYSGRALLVATGACAIHCRYCFRREFPYAEQQLDRRRIADALAYLSCEPSIQEVILSGGDPLLLGNERFGELLKALRSIPHLRRIRIHTRIPVVLPSRIDGPLLQHLAASQLPVTLVIHANHANELGSAAQQALRQLRQSGLMLLNQSVLLRGVNNHAKTLIELSEALHDCGVLPYYLHLLDRVRGAAHFEVDDLEASMLYETLRRSLPGYLVPRMVREQAGAPYKLPVESAAPGERDFQPLHTASTG